MVDQLKVTESNYNTLMEDYKALKEKLDNSGGNVEEYAVVAVLSDKLKYKEKIIERQVGDYLFLLLMTFTVISETVLCRKISSSLISLRHQTVNTLIHFPVLKYYTVQCNNIF